MHVLPRLPPCADDTASSCSPAAAGPPPAPKLRWETAYNGAAPHAELKQLKPAHRYLVQVKAFNSVGGSPWSEVLEVVTASAAPGAPASLTATAISSSSIQLSWQPPAEDHGAPVTAYQLEVVAGGSSSASAAAASWARMWQGSGSTSGTASSSASCNGDAGDAADTGLAGSWNSGTAAAASAVVLHHTMDGLQPGRKYSWRLRAVNACGPGPWCGPEVGKTLPAEPGPAGKPTLSKVTASTVTAKWPVQLEDNGAPVTHYTVQVRQLQQAGAGGADRQHRQPLLQEWTTVYEGKDITHKVIGLHAGTQYELRVAAVNKVGRGSWSEAVGWTTMLMPPPAPHGVTAQLQQQLSSADTQQQQQHSALAAWQQASPPADCAEAVGYEVEATPTAAGTGAAGGSSQAMATAAAATAAAATVRAMVGQASTTSTVLAGLRSGLTYRVRVRAVGKGGAGHSHWSEAAQVVTPEAPAAPKGDAAAAGVGLVGEAGRSWLCCVLLTV